MRILFLFSLAIGLCIPAFSQKSKPAPAVPNPVLDESLYNALEWRCVGPFAAAARQP